MGKKRIIIVAALALCISHNINAMAEEYASYTSSAGMSAAIEISSGPMIFSASDGSDDTGGTEGTDSTASGPGSGSSRTSTLQPSSTGDGIISSDPGAPAASSSSSAVSYSSSSALGPTSSGTTSSGTTSSGSAGSAYSSETGSVVELGFTLVSPAHEYGDYMVAEGSVQLSDGTWVSLGYDQYIYSGYYRLLREETDSTGVEWYVVAFHGTVIGNYHTEDGSVVEELWLKKSDCTATSAIELNTSDPVRQNIIRTALSLLGKGYVYGETGPDTFDCSGFVYYVMGQNGISTPRSSSEIISYGSEVGLSGLRAGDIVGKNGHVGIYIADDWFIHSSDTHTGVLVDSIELYNSTAYAFTNYRNILGD